MRDLKVSALFRPVGLTLTYVSLITLVISLIVVSALPSQPTEASLPGSNPEPHPEGAPVGPPHHWLYQDQESWAQSYPLCKGRDMRQSPIDIITSDTVRDDNMTIEFIDYNQPIGIKTSNNGHSACINPIPPNPQAVPRVRLNGFLGGSSTNEYELNEVHFHWGEQNKHGSEHKLNGEQASAEMHMVHIRKGLQKSDIGSVENSVVVVGVFLEPSMFYHNQVVEEVVEDTSLVNGTDVGEVRSSSRKENLREMIPLIGTNFYSYNGSLTTPPCYEVVTWVVIDKPVYISRQELLELQNLETRDENGIHKIDVNFRKTQPLRNRPVFVSNSLKQVTTNSLKKHLKQTLPDSKRRQNSKSGSASSKLKNLRNSG